MNKKLVSNSNFVLRKVLNNGDCLGVLKDFIESILEIKIDEIELNPYLTQREKYLPREENFGIADVRVKTEDNQEINVGIQFIDGIYVETKMLLYYAQIHLNQDEYDEKRELCKTVTINILDFKHLNMNKYDNVIRIQSNEQEITLDELEMHLIELPKIRVEDMNDLSAKEEWLLYLKEDNKKVLSRIKNENIHYLDSLLNKYWLEEKME